MAAHDKLVIHDLAAACRIGVSEEERAAPQTLWVDLELAIDAPRAAARDDVHAALDYAKLVAVVKERVEHRPYHLLEAVAEEVAALILREFDTPEVEVRVKKRALPGIDYAAVEVKRRAK